MGIITIFVATALVILFAVVISYSRKRTRIVVTAIACAVTIYFVLGSLVSRGKEHLFRWQANRSIYAIISQNDCETLIPVFKTYLDEIESGNQEIRSFFSLRDSLNSIETHEDSQQPRGHIFQEVQ